ncbi:hypothetical protein C8J56DRAFT_929713 [Mycena floridula]|nr:hypothetical protein C8J56DRAFT_929713 [Mycena floridula]
MSQSEMAARFKDEGNALFAKQKFVEACAKYTEAIDFEPSAVLYANRAACRLNTKEYLAACDDSKMAIQLDPSYAKAHARLATAHDYMNAPWQSVLEWGSAVDALRKDNLTTAEIKQKAQYEAGLMAARKNLMRSETPRNAAEFLPIVEERDTMNLPWYQAYAVIPKLRSEGKLSSSAFVIAEAHQDFASGIQAMKEAHWVGKALVGRIGAIADISNAILRDDRIFHIKDQNWISMYNLQVQLEATKTNAWIDSGAETVIKQAQERLASGGWDNVRPALATTIRCWILRGFLDSGLDQNHTVFVEFMNNAAEVIVAGQKLWKDVSREERGTVFDDTFLRGVLNMQLDALMKAYNAKSSPDINDLEVLKAKAETLIRLVEDSPAPLFGSRQEPGFINSFWHYPKGRAHTMIAFYHKKMAETTKDQMKKEDHLQEASVGYLTAATCYPLDDENHAFFIACALQNAVASGPAPLGVFINMLDRLHIAIPAFQPIWKHSITAMQGRDDIIKSSMTMEPYLRERLASGQATLDAIIGINFN